VVRPWQIKRIIGRLRRLGLGHDLDHDTPLRKFTVLDRAKQGLLVPFADPSHDLAYFAIGEMATIPFAAPAPERPLGLLRKARVPGGAWFDDLARVLTTAAQDRIDQTDRIS